jgi:hypothetical protein
MGTDIETDGPAAKLAPSLFHQLEFSVVGFLKKSKILGDNQYIVAEAE